MKIFLKIISLVFTVAFLTNCAYVRPSQSHSQATGLQHPADFYGYGFQGYEKAPNNKFIVYKESKKRIRKFNILAEGAPMFIPSNPKENSIKNGPSGTVWVGEKDLWIDRSERSNLEWHEFLRAVKQDSSSAYYLSMLPDAEVITLQERNSYQASKQKPEPLGTYFLHPDYLYFPVVGISYYQASEYCKWKGAILTEYFNQFVQKKDNPVKLSFRLPTEEEWERIASLGVNLTNYPYAISQMDIAVEIKDEFADYALFKLQKEVSHEQLLTDIQAYNETSPRTLVVNCKQESPYFLQFRTPSPVLWGEKDLFGLYNMVGNVAEMVSEKGIAKGGSWKHTLDESKIKDKITYTGPNDHVGFRCICEVERVE